MIVFVPSASLPRPLLEGDLHLLAKTIDHGVRTKGVQCVGLRFVSEKEIMRLNKIYRGKNHPTDVLSFGSIPVPLPKSASVEQGLGDVIICSVYALREAKRRMIPPREEYFRLIVHGVLHLLGYDHTNLEDELKMFQIQEACVEKVFSCV